MLPTLQQPIWNQTRPPLHFSLALHSPNKQNKQRNKRAFLLLLFVLHPEFVKTRHRDISNHNKTQEKNIQTSILKYCIKASLQWVFLQLIYFTALWVHKRLPSTVSMQRISAAIFLRCDKAFFFVCLHWNHNLQLMLHILALIKIKKNHFLSSSPPGHSWLHRTILPVHFLQADPSCLKLPTCKELILYLWQSEPLNPFLNLCKIGLRDGRSAHGSWMQMHHKPRQLPIFFCSVLS